MWFHAAMTEPTREQRAPLSCDESLALLAMIDRREGNWNDRLSVLMYVARYPGGDWMSSREIGEWTGLPPGSVRNLLAELVDARIVLRWGTKPKWCELNPAVHEWRGVPWTASEFTIRQRLAFHADRAEISTETRFFARHMAARSAAVFARGRLGTLARIARDGARDPRGDSLGEPKRESRGLGRADRALYGRADTAGSSRETPASRAVIAALPQQQFSSGDGASESPPVELERTGGAELDAAIIARGCDIVFRVAAAGPNGRKFIAERIRREIADLIATYDIDAFRSAAVAVAGVGQQVPAVVDAARGYLAAAAAGDHELAVACVDQGPDRRDWLRGRIRVLRSLEGAFADDAEFEAERVLELDAWEHELAKIDAQEAAFA